MKTRSFFVALLTVSMIISNSSCKGKKSVNSSETPVLLTVSDSNQERMIIAKLFVKQERISDFISAAQVMIQSSNAEPGCEFYQLFQDPYNRSNFVFVEKYANQAAVDVHFNTSYFKAFGPQIADMLLNPSEISIIKISGEEKK